MVGRRTWPLSPNGFRDCSDESRPVCCDVLTGTSSRRVQPRELSESRKVCDVIAEDLRMAAVYAATDVSGIQFVGLITSVKAWPGEGRVEGSCDVRRAMSMGA